MDDRQRGGHCRLVTMDSLCKIGTPGDGNVKHITRLWVYPTALAGIIAVRPQDLSEGSANLPQADDELLHRGAVSTVPWMAMEGSPAPDCIQSSNRY